MIASSIVFFLLFLLPFVIAPFGVTQFEDPKVVIAEGFVILLLIISLFSKHFIFRWRTAQAMVFAFIFLLTILDLIFLRTPIMFFGNPFRMQGIFLLWLLLLFSFVSAGVQNLEPLQQKLRLLSYGWFFTFLLLAELVAMVFLPLNASQRYVGTLGEPNALGAFAVFVWPFGWLAFNRSKRGYWGKILLLLIVGSILVLTDSRSAMVAFGIQLVFLILRKFRLSFSTTAIICLLLFIASYALPFFQNDPYENRVQVWESAFYAGWMNPGIGQGFGNIEVALQNSAAGLDLPTQYYYVDSSHNIFLDWWVAGGALGLGTLIYIIYLAWRRFVTTQNALMFILLIATLTVLSFNPASVIGLLGFWWIMGQGFAEDTIKSH